MIETKRLYLRQLTADDRQALAELLGDPEVMASSDEGPFDPDQVDDWLNNQLVQYGDNLGRLAIIRRSDERFVGYCGLMPLENVDGRPEIDIGYRLARSAWGNGYATEATIAIRDHAFEVLGLSRLVALIEPINRRSIRVAEKVGMSYEKDVTMPGYDHPDHLYSIVNPGEGSRRR